MQNCIIKSARDGGIIPSNIEPNVPVVWAYDNDFMEETRTGSNTTHCTSGIVVQRRNQKHTSITVKSSSAASPKLQSIARTKPRHKRSLQLEELQPLFYNAGPRTGPERVNLSIDHLMERGGIPVCSKEDFSWLLAHLPKSSSMLVGHDQRTPD